jgi:hypothetical protein
LGPWGARSRDRRPVAGVSRKFPLARGRRLSALGGTALAEQATNDVGRPRAIAWAAADDQGPGRVAASGDLDDVVGLQVGGGVGGAAQLGHAGAPVAHGGTVGGDSLGAAAAFGAVVVQVGPGRGLAPVDLALAPRAAVAPAAQLAAVQACAAQGHLGFRRLRWRSSRWQAGQRSP